MMHSLNQGKCAGSAMLRTWRKQYVRLLRSTFDTFGFEKVFWKMLLGKPVMLHLDRLFFRLDPMLYPGCVAQRVTKPVFIIGHPRSGTTFLHRFIHASGEFVCFQFWEIIFTALTARKLFYPWIAKRKASGKDVIVPQETGHEQRLDSIEEEELLWYKYLSTQFIYVYTPLAFSEEPWDEIVFGDRQPRQLVCESMAYLRGCFQRQMYWTKKDRIVANMNYSGMRLKNLLEAFPDGRIVFLERSPYETIPSHLTLDLRVLDYLWDLRKLPAEGVKRYLTNRYAYDVAYYRYMDQMDKEGVFRSGRVLRVRYEDFTKDFRDTMLRVFEFAELPVSEVMRRRIDDQHLRQRTYRPGHWNLKLEDFGFSPEKLAKDLADGVGRSKDGVSDGC